MFSKHFIHHLKQPVYGSFWPPSVKKRQYTNKEPYIKLIEIDTLFYLIGYIHTPSLFSFVGLLRIYAWDERRQWSLIVTLVYYAKHNIVCSILRRIAVVTALNFSVPERENNGRSHFFLSQSCNNEIHHRSNLRIFNNNARGSKSKKTQVQGWNLGIISCHTHLGVFFVCYKCKNPLHVLVCILI